MNKKYDTMQMNIRKEQTTRSLYSSVGNWSICLNEMYKYAGEDEQRAIRLLFEQVRLIKQDMEISGNLNYYKPLSKDERQFI